MKTLFLWDKEKAKKKKKKIHWKKKEEKKLLDFFSWTGWFTWIVNNVYLLQGIGVSADRLSAFWNYVKDENMAGV